MTKMRRFNAIFDGIINSLAFVAGSFIIIMTLIECYEVIARYYLRRPPIWGVEACEYMLFLLAFLGTAWVLRQKGHITVNILIEHMRPKTQIYFNLLASLVGILISLIIFWFGMKTSWENYVTNVRVVKTLSLPKWVFLSFISLGYLLLLIEFLRQFVDQWSRLRLKKEERQIL